MFIRGSDQRCTVTFFLTMIVVDDSFGLIAPFTIPESDWALKFSEAEVLGSASEGLENSFSGVVVEGGGALSKSWG